MLVLRERIGSIVRIFLDAINLECFACLKYVENDDSILFSINFCINRIFYVIMIIFFSFLSYFTEIVHIFIYTFIKDATEMCVHFHLLCLVIREEHVQDPWCTFCNTMQAK